MALTYAKNTVGADSQRRTTFKEFELGSVERGASNKAMVYGKASAAIPAGACAITIATGVIAAGAGYTADAAFALNEYGWVVKADL